jgi:hypothetical protein
MCKHLLYVRQHNCGRLGELKLLARLLVQRDTKFPFQCLELLMNRRRTQVKVLRDLGDIPQFGESDQAAKLIQFHGS